MSTEEKLDLLAEFHSQKDALELTKRDLLNEIKVPAEIEAIVSQGMKAIDEIENGSRQAVKSFNVAIDEEIAKIVIPAEIQAELAEIEKKRTEVLGKCQDIQKQRADLESQKREYEQNLSIANNMRRKELQDEIEAKTKGVYDEIEKRKRDIEAEFSGKADDVNQNIQKLEAEIKDEVKAGGKSVKGKFFHAVYVKGRVTWNQDKMEAWIVDHPFLKDARKEGEPSITLRRTG